MHRRFGWVVAAHLALAACGGPSANGDGGAQDGGSDAANPDGGPAVNLGDTRLYDLAPDGHDRLFGVAFNSDGSFFGVGTIADTTAAAADHRTLVAKFTATGELDRSWGTNGFVSHNLKVGTSGEVAHGIVVQRSGKIVVGATIEATGASDARDRDVAVARFNADGSLDSTFGTMGVTVLNLSEGAINGTSYTADGMWSLAQDSDGRVIVTATQRRMGGLDSDFAVVRLTEDGQRDRAFATDGVFALDIENQSADVRTSTVLPSGNILVSGYYSTAAGVVRPVLFQLTSAGVLDPSFGTMGVYSETVLGVSTEAYGALAQGGAFVTAGYGRSSSSEDIDWLSLRVSANGTRDRTWGTDGVARLDFMGFNDNARALVVLPDSRVLLVGGARSAEDNSDGALAMLTSNGQLDTSFGTMGKMQLELGGGSDFFWDAALSPTRTSVAVVGSKSVGVVPIGDDDVAVLVVRAP